LLGIFTPVITILMAGMIGTIVMSVLLAILSVNELVG
jgi:type II secretory pathway component PulF